MQNNGNNGPNIRFIVIFALAVWLLAATLFYYLVGYGVAISILLGLLAGVIATILLYLGMNKDQPGQAAPAPKQAGSTASTTIPAAASAPSTKAAPEPAQAATAPKAAASKPAAKPKAATKPKASGTKPASKAASEAGAAAKTPKAAPKAAPKATATKTAKTTTKPAAAVADTAPPKAAAKPKTAPKPAANKPVAADGKPELLTKARAGGADNLKMIKGVGPKLEKLLNDMGVFHFDQVASWRKKEVEWVDGNIEGFKGRVSRDKWVKQAKVLAKGGTTEFSARVKKGGVY